MNIHNNGTGVNRAEVVAMVIASVQEVLILGNGNSPDATAIGEETRLFGRKAVLDSMGLVTLIVEIEQRLEEDYDVAVVLADDRAMSMKRSPFRSVQSLSDYIVQLVDVREPQSNEEQG
jgi:acyl carrier protein